MKVDLHVHTIFSWDSIIRMEKLKALDGAIAITDHDTIKAHERTKKLGIKFIAGEEITTNIGHLLAFFVNEEVNKKKEVMDFFEALDIIKGQGAISCFAHPFDKLRASLFRDENYFERALREVDCIEVYNAKNKEENDRKAFETAKRLGKPMTAGSDSHIGKRLFSAYVEMPDFSLDSPSEFLKSLSSSEPIIRKRRSLSELLELRIRRVFKIY